MEEQNNKIKRNDHSVEKQVEFQQSKKYDSRLWIYIFAGIIIIGIYGFLNSNNNNIVALVLNFTKPVIVMNIESQDELKVVVNGSVGPFYLGIVSMDWNWGDGTKNDGFFPQNHTYSQPGKYKIVTTARSLFGIGDGYSEL